MVYTDTMRVLFTVNDLFDKLTTRAFQNTGCRDRRCGDGFITLLMG